MVNISCVLIRSTKNKLLHVLFVVLLTGFQNAEATVISSTDIWDVSQNGWSTTTGGISTGNSGSTFADNMFGCNCGGPEGSNTIFKDTLNGVVVPEGYIHWVEWQTASVVDLRRFNLVALHDGTSTPPARAFKHFNLLTGDGSGNWTSIFEIDTLALYGQGENYTQFNYLELEVDLNPISAQFFRAEFTQAAPKPSNAHFAQGPRILELDGYGTFKDGTTTRDVASVPEPTTLALFGLGLIGLSINRRNRLHKG